MTVASLGVLDLSRTVVTATNTDGLGLQMTESSVVARDSTISGGLNGILIVAADRKLTQ
ncbi:hypothetical protein QNM99_19045 [Pseudomonas sp. PCH446]